MADRGLLIPDRYTDAMERIEIAGNTAFLVGWDGEVRGTIGVADTVRDSAAEAVSTLQEMGVDVVMLTGDNQRTAETIAAQIGITTVIAEVLPGDKAEEIRRLQHNGRSVGFVGDGINDAPALTQADLGMAVGSGTDVAIEAGDVVLMNGDPMLAVTSLRLARKTFATIKQNLYWALVPMSIWAAAGFNMLLFLAAMESIPPTVYEAADIDGASPWLQFWTITLPLIWEVLSISIVFMIIGGMKAFEVIWLLTNQRPVTENHVIGTRMVQAMFKEFHVGEATAIAVILFLIVFFGTTVTLRLMRRETVEF